MDNEIYKFKIGDSVHLKSGSPQLIISDIHKQIDRIIITCEWFDNEDKKHSATFNSLTLAPTK